VPNTDPLNNIRIVLCAPTHPGNIGAAARAMKTMGLARLYLVAPRRFPDPEAEWRASRADDVLAHAVVCARLEEALADVGFALACSARPRELAVSQVTAREAAAEAVAIAHVQQVACVFGNETYGLTTEEVNRCQLLTTIPANPEYSSLNLAAAVQVIAYELRLAAMAGTPAPARPRQLASFEELEGLYAHLEQGMAETGFFDPQHPKKLMPRLRRLFARARLEKEEVNILRGIVKSFQCRKNSGGDDR
jgi:tRNA/rRNA methyltransferase